MAWDIVPANGVNYRSWPFVRQFYDCIAEKAAACGDPRWPRTSHIWDEGLISSITSTSVTITELDSSPKAWATDRWVTNGGLDYAPTSYDLIIESTFPADPRLCIHTTITAQTGDDSLTIGDITQRVTERVCSSVSSLVGRRCYIIKRNGIWWSERWMEWPNSTVYAHATVAAADTAGELVAARLSPAEGVSLVGKDILFYNTSNVLQRGAITDVTDSTITFTGTTGTATVDSDIVVVAANAYFSWPAPGTPPNGGQIRLAYRGAQTGYYSHDADDERNTISKPRVSIALALGTDPMSCPIDPTTYPIFDVDFWTDYNEACELPDISYAPDIYKTLRGLWVAALGLSPYFVDPGSNDVTDYEHQPNEAALMREGSALNAAGINGGSTTGGTVVGGELPISVSAPYYPVDFWWTIIGPDGQSDLEGSAGFYEAYTGGTVNVGSGLSSDFNGATVRYSFGPKRFVPRKFQRMYDVTGFIPDIDEEAAVWPPTEDNPGSYDTRAASTHYLVPDNYNFIGESTHAIDAFASGDLARYVGDNFQDPGIYPRMSTDDPLLPYYEKFFVGTRKPETEANLRLLKSGTATSGTARQLTDSTKNWWGGDFWGSSSVFSRTGTATGGSTTTLVDSTKSGSAFWNSSTRSQVGLVVIVTISSVEHRRLITSHSGTTIGFDEALPSSASGKAYEIRENDGLKNRWKGRTLTITQGEDSATVVISGNDDKTLFFPDCGFTIDDTATYSITERGTGGVWKWDGSSWIVPTGTDSRGDVPFMANQSANAPTCVVRYGLPRLGDYVFTTNWVELYTFLNKLRWTKDDLSWTSREDPEVPEDNQKGQQTDTFGGYDYPTDTYPDKAAARAGILEQLDGYWDNNPLIGEMSGTRPFWRTDISITYGWRTVPVIEDGLGFNTATYATLYAYPYITGTQRKAFTVSDGILSKGVHFFVRADKLSDYDGLGADAVSTYDDNGEPLEEGVYMITDSFSGDDDGFQGGKISSNDKPTAPAGHEPVTRPAYTDDPNTSTGYEAKGFIVTGEYAILCWDVGGGFKYID